MQFSTGLASLLVVSAMMAPNVSLASSGDAWAEFQAEVATACRAAIGLDADATILVEPYGSERFGYAVHESETGPVVCVYEKTTGTTEVGREFVAFP